MSWDFETDPEFQAELDWVDDFVRNEVEPVDQVIHHAWDMKDPVRRALIPPLQQQVRDRGLWACHLGPNLGGPGYGQVKLALLNEILGRSHSAPIVFGCQAPDSGNAEILAHYGTDELKKRYLKPLLAQEVVSAYSMTEPRGGSDPTGFVTRAERDGDEWVINGEKWFSSHANFAEFLIAAGGHRSRRGPAPQDVDVRRRQVRPRASRSSATSASTAIPTRRARTATCATPTCGSPPTTCSAGSGEGFLVAQTRPRRRSHPPRHADHRTRQERLRPDVRARPVARHAGRDVGAQTARAGDDRRLLDPDRAVPSARAAHGVADRQVGRLPAGASRHLRGQGSDAEGAARRGQPSAADPRLARRDATRCRSLRWCSSRSTWASPTAPRKCTRSRSPASC